MLTKEECREAYEVIDTLLHLICGEKREDGYEPTMNETISSMKTLKQLIQEHFYNPPLKFEELKEGDWVWDNKTKEYIVCSPNINVMGQRCVCYWCGYTFLDGEFDEDYIIFEEKRFFRKEFQKND